MPDYLEQIKELEDELKKTKYNKRTQHHIGLVKAKIARLRESQIKRSSGGKKGEGYSVKKSGNASVVLVGYPSAGKSTLLNILTNANSKVGAYSFTTLTVIPGQMNYEHAKIQILDVPGIVKGASIGTGRGKEVLAVMRNADLVVYVIDINTPEHFAILEKEVYDSGLRINQEPPVIKIKKTGRGGIRIGTTVNLTRISKETISAILREFRINNADVLIRDNITDEQLIDVIEANKAYMPGIIVLNKMDMIPKEEALKIKKKIRADILISAQKGENIDKLKRLIFRKLNFTRIYLKEPGKPPDMEEPLIINGEVTLGRLCDKLHKDFMKKFKFARVWGKSVKYDGQKVLKTKHKLDDKDVVELHIS